MEAPQIAGPLNRLRVCFQAADEAGCGGYRCILPVGQLRKLGAKAKWTHRVQRQDYVDYDVFVYQRPYDPTLVREMQEVSRLGKLTVIESDDNLHRVHQNSPVYKYYKPGKTQEPFNNAMKVADGMVVSTPELAQYYYRFNRNIFVAPNSIDLTLGVRDWSGTNDETGRQEGEVILFWRGGITHMEDLKSLGNTVPYIMDKYPQVRLALYSAIPLCEWAINHWNVPRDRVTIIPPRNFCQYPRGLGGGDILLVPLIQSEFNDAKSELALAEVGALKIPSVCASSAAYLRFADGNKYARVAGVAGSWIDHLSDLIENEKTRKDLGNAAYQRVLDNYNLDLCVWNWVKGFDAIQEAKNAGVTGPGTRIVDTFEIGPNKPCIHCVQEGNPAPPKTKKCTRHKTGAWNGVPR